MKKYLLVVLFVAVYGTTSVLAQPPGPPEGRGPRGPENDRGSATTESMISKLMALDKNKDGNLTIEEVADARLTPMLKLADTNSDGIVTKPEISVVLEQQPAASVGGGRPQGDRRGSPDGLGGRPEDGMRSGPGGGFGPPRMGQIVPSFVAQRLGLSTQQVAAIEQLQAEVDAQLAKILTADQLQQLQQPAPGQRGEGGPPRR